MKSRIQTNKVSKSFTNLRIWTRQRSFLPLILGTIWFLAQPCAASPFAFSYTGSLSTARTAYTATLLQNGKVLVAGGQDAGGVLASAELYDPATGSWSA